MDLFGKVAVASTFSPRFAPMLAKARAIATLLDRPLKIIHAGQDTPENEERFAEVFAKMQFSGPVHWRQAAQPSDAIIQVVRENRIGLLVVGAMERSDSQGRFFLGKVSRILVREAPCSLLLVANPASEAAPFRQLAVVVDYSDASRQALKAALKLAALTNAEALHVLRVYTVFAQFLARPLEFVTGDEKGALGAEEARLDAFVQEFEIGDVPVITRCIEGTTGFAAADVVQSIEADLLVTATETKLGQSQFPAGMEWLENVIPSNLLVIRAPGEGSATAPPNPSPAGG